MISKIFTATPNGFEANLVEIETDVSNGLPTTIIVGLPDTIVQESRERVRSAIRNSGFSYPVNRISINLAPSDLPKVGSHFDVAIALSILLAGKLISFNPDKKMFIGELSLDGSIRSTSAVLSMVLLAKKLGITEVFIPYENYAEASLVKGVLIIPVRNLKNLVNHLSGKKVIDLNDFKELTTRENISQTINLQTQAVEVDFKNISGQSSAKRALLIAACGFHNLRMVGPPGSGKTMLAKAFAGILPNLSDSEFLETANIYSLAGKFRNKNFLNELKLSRPFRSPHHTASSLALIGGGAKPRPGEISLAHNGVLFLDELPEFSQNVLEVLRQPLEDKTINIMRFQNNITFPANFILITAQNPCRCGNYGDPTLVCICHPSNIARYNKKISGPLLDRIDIHINVPRLKYSEIKNNNKTEQSSEQLKLLVEKVWNIQQKRFAKNNIGFKGSLKTNSLMTQQEVQEFCQLGTDTENLLAKAVDAYHLSGRSIQKILKVARTIADLENEKNIQMSHLSESLQYRINNLV